MTDNIKQNLSDLENEISSASALAMQKMLEVFNQVNEQLIQTQKMVFQPIIERIDQYEKLRDLQIEDHKENQDKLIKSLMDAQSIFFSSTVASTLGNASSIQPDSTPTAVKAQPKLVAKKTTIRKPLAKKPTTTATPKAPTKTPRKPLVKKVQSDSAVSSTASVIVKPKPKPKPKPTSVLAKKPGPKPKKPTKPAAARKPLVKTTTPKPVVSTPPTVDKKPVAAAKKPGPKPKKVVKPKAIRKPLVKKVDPVSEKSSPTQHKDFNKPLSELGITPMIGAGMERLGLKSIGQFAFPTKEDETLLQKYKSMDLFPTWVSKAKELLS